MSDQHNAELDARLDEAFRSLPDTEDLRDLRDELRAGLAARVAELEAEGSGPAAAIATAFAELGDVREIAAEVVGPAALRDGDASAEPSRTAQGARAAELSARHRVRPKPAFVVRTVLLGIVAAAGAALTVLTVVGVLATPLWLTILIAVVLVAVPLGVIAGDAVHQETTAHYPVPAGRAVGYGASTFLGFAALGLGAAYLTDLSQIWLVIVGAPLLLAAIGWLSYLAATQTNRTKPWLRDLQSHYQGADRFSQDEAAAARFGIYTMVIFVVAIAAFIVLSFTVGFAWSWLALVAGFVVFFVVLARMLFPSGSSESNDTHTNGANRD